jgi:hypothetical protein
MNITTTIIGIGALALFVIPLLILSNLGKNRRKKLVNQLSMYAAEQSGNLHEYDHWKNSIIGIDLANKKVYYLSKQNGELKKILIPLNDVQKCKLTGINPLNLNQADTQIQLEFSYRDPKQSDAKIQFFNTKVDTFIVEDDLKLPQKWLSIVNRELENCQTK